MPIDFDVKLYDEDKIKSLLDNAWLGLGDVSKIDIPQSFLNDNSEERIYHPDVHLLRHLRKPENFWLTCKIIFNIDLLPFQVVILQQLWTHPFPLFLATRGGSKTFMLALYAMLRALFTQGCKIVVVAAGFRQSKMLFDYAETMWNNAPILRSLVGATGKNGSGNGPHKQMDKFEMIIGESTIISIPIGDGSRIRGLRANYIISDEFQSMNPEIYENVIQGFANVSASPSKSVKARAREEQMKKLNISLEKTDEVSGFKGNQSIISGTAYYSFNHFYKYYNNYKKIIETRGNPRKLRELFGGEEPPPNFNWRDYCIIRIPIELLPAGFMDDSIVARAKATVHSSIFGMEYGCLFTTDSNGFFKRTLIESCVTKTPINDIQFHAVTRGDSDKRYIYGIDPASEKDNFSIVVLEINDDHRRIVYCWTTTRKNHQDKIKAGAVKEHDFYAYCARKIRELMQAFPCEAIGMDAQGGGIAVEEALHDLDKLRPGEKPIWRVIEEDKEKESDNYQGLHILHMVQFAKADWTSAANHGMRKDFEDKALLFPYYDSLAIEIAIQDDKNNNRLFDTLEDCVIEIEELKDELATIVHTQTGVSGRDRWDTPEIKEPGTNKKGRLRKDRYSALVIANAVARNIARKIDNTPEYHTGGFVGTFKTKNPQEDLSAFYTGAGWFTNATGGLIDSYGSVKRGV